MASIMDMDFPNDDVPDFGSIRLVYVHGYARGYILLSADAEKLDLLSNAGSGSVALCADTGDVYIKHDATWYKQ